MRIMLAALLVPAVAHADPPKCKSDGESYRGTLLLADGLVWGALVGAYYRGFPAEVAIPAYWFVAPGTHADHCQGNRAMLSFAARLVLPTLGAGVAKHTDDRYIGVSLVAGGVLASALDISFLGGAEPIVTPAPGGATVGLVATF